MRKEICYFSIHLAKSNMDISQKKYSRISELPESRNNIFAPKRWLHTEGQYNHLCGNNSQEH